MEIRQFMKRDVISIASAATVREATELFVRHHVGTLPVVDADARLVGVLYMRDLLQLVMPAFVDLIEDFDYVRNNFGDFEELKPPAAMANQMVAELMEKPISVSDSSGLLRCFAILDKYDIYDLPVVDRENRLVGLASVVDVGAALLATWPAAFSKGT